MQATSGSSVRSETVTFLRCAQENVFSPLSKSWKHSDGRVRRDQPSRRLQNSSARGCAQTLTRHLTKKTRGRLPCARPAALSVPSSAGRQDGNLG